MDTVYILWLRQMKHYFRSGSRIIGSIGQPLLFLFAFGLGFGPVFEQAGETDYFQFLVPGIIGMSILFTSMFNGIDIIWDRQFGFLKETLVAPVSRIYIMLGRTLGGATIAVFQGIIILAISLLVGFQLHEPLIIPAAILFMFLTALLFSALGIAIASQLEDMQGFPLIMNFLIMPLFLLSGALFPLKNLPAALNIIVHINPLSYGVDGIRGSLLGLYEMGLWLNLGALSAIAILLLTIGAYFFSKIQI